MAFKDDLDTITSSYFKGTFTVTDGTAIPDVADIGLGNQGRQLELAMLFIDIRESTKIVDAFRRTTAARMYKAFLDGVSRIARHNDGELRSFNGDGVLVAFVGNRKRTNAVTAAGQMAWACRKILKGYLKTYFENNKQAADLEFDFGIGVASGTVLVVRGGIRGENNNDLVWVGNATNYAVKLAALGSHPWNVWITGEVYDNMDKDIRTSSDGQAMFEKRVWTAVDNMTIYRSDWGRVP